MSPRPASGVLAPRKNSRRLLRFEVRLKRGLADPRAQSLARESASIGLPTVSARVARVYLIQGGFDDGQIHAIAGELLANPVLETATIGAEPVEPGAVCVEIHPLPGVMDPPAQTVEMAVRELTGVAEVHASTGWRYDLTGISSEQAQQLAQRLLANPVIQAIHREPFWPEDFPRGGKRELRLIHIPIRELSDEELGALSRQAHLFLSLDEMRAIQRHYRALGREPTDVELETLAQTWSEHCAHKTFKSDIVYRGPADDVIDFSSRPGHEILPDGSVKIRNLLKSTIAAATFELIEEGLDWALSVFVDNAGVIGFDDEHAVCVKVETHNHPSAIEPYGGAATGVGGCIRDIIATGLAAKPIANTDVFCVAYPEHFDKATLPAGCLHPKRILQQVVAGVRDYGNRMGVPTLSGAVYFDDCYVGNPLVYCGCVGVMPRDKIAGAARPGDRIIALGGRTGRDGVHGATFSSAELTDTHADEFSTAVQIGNPIEEKKLLDAIGRAREAAGGPLFHAINDCGAGGFSSAVGEMGEQLGVEVHLEKAPLKYDGLSYCEIWISEAQERMVLAVPAENLPALAAICEEESVELADLGHFGVDNRELILYYNNNKVGRLSMEFLFEGSPRRTRRAVWPGSQAHAASSAAPPSGQGDIKETLLGLLGSPNIASKRWIVRQYDHEVQGATVIKPMVGPGGDGPGDATVIQPVPGSKKGLAVSQGLAVDAGDPAKGGDPYRMALEAVDECVRNLVCVGADPDRIAILDNFCWPGCESPENLGALVRAAEGCYDAAKAHKTPFVSGKDSLNNQFTTDDGRTIEIPPTLLITGVGIVPDISSCVTMDLKCGRPGGEKSRSSEKDGRSTLLLVGDSTLKQFDIERAHATAVAIHALIHDGLALSVHDCSEGGVAVAVAEMVIAARSVGATLILPNECNAARTDDEMAALFGAGPGRYILEIDADDAHLAQERLRAMGAPVEVIGWAQRGAPELRFQSETGRRGPGVDVSVEAMRGAFFGAMDW